MSVNDFAPLLSRGFLPRIHAIEIGYKKAESLQKLSA
jgi:hypothetical protein